MGRSFGYNSVSAALAVLLLAALGAVLFIENTVARYAVFGALVVLGEGIICIHSIRRKKRMAKVSSILSRETMFEEYINSAAIPTVILDTHDRIMWQNPVAATLFGTGAEGRNIFKILPELAKPDKSKIITVNGRKYTRDLANIRFEGSFFKILRLIDKEKVIRTVDVNRSVLPVVCFIEIDSHGVFHSELTTSEMSFLDSKIDRLVEDFANKYQGMILKYAGDRYLLCFEHKHLLTIQESRFQILDQVRDIKASNGQSPTLSIAVGAGDTMSHSETYALQALDLARGRGGDQAVVKDAKGYSFYGGVQRAVEVRSRVRTRSVSKAFRSLMEQCQDVFIMGHENPDMDCIGSALGIVACARVLGKRTYMILDKPNASIAGAVAEIKKRYKEIFITPAKAHMLIDNRSMMVVVDTQVKDHVMAPWLLEDTENIVVIDHHLKGTGSITGAALFYHEPYASSTAEMVTEVMQYFSERVKPTPLEAEALLAGLMIDTKSFSFKTGVRTFEAASYLRKSGADTTTVKILYQDDLDTFVARAAVVEAATVEKGIAVSECPKKSKNSALLAAQSADALLGIKGVTASFVLAEDGERVLISGRSLGVVNVQLILERMGGGGHATIAGVQLSGMPLAEARRQLEAQIKDYIKNNQL